MNWNWEKGGLPWGAEGPRSRTTLRVWSNNKVPGLSDPWVLSYDVRWEEVLARGRWAVVGQSPRSGLPGTFPVWHWKSRALGLSCCFNWKSWATRTVAHALSRSAPQPPPWERSCPEQQFSGLAAIRTTTTPGKHPGQLHFWRFGWGDPGIGDAGWGLDREPSLWAISGLSGVLFLFHGE